MPDPPSLHEQRGIMLEHYALAESIYGEDRVGPLMRKFGIKYAILHPDHDAVRAGFVRIKTRTEWEAALDKFYSEDRPGCYPDGRMHKAQGSCAN